MVIGVVLAGLLLAPDFRVCIDPGHPSELNDGFGVSNGLTETAVNWKVSVLLKKQLERMGGFAITFTKSSEKQLVKNRERAEIANRFNADLFLRIHADAVPQSGFTIFYPKAQGKAQGKVGPSRQVIERSGRLAAAFHAAMAAELKGVLPDRGVKGEIESNIGSKQGALTGSIFSTVPVMLVEMCSLTNKHDADWIRQPVNQQKMALALAKGCAAARDAAISRATQRLGGR